MHASWDDDHFDVVCFEALEHVPSKTRHWTSWYVSSLRMSLASVLSESAVYPPENPFHLHEFNQRVAGGGRQTSGKPELWKHTRISSVLVQEGRFPPDHTISAGPNSRPFVVGTDPYSFVMREMDRSPHYAVRHMRTSDQLLHLEALSALVTEERGAHSRRTDHPPRATGQTPRTRSSPSRRSRRLRRTENTRGRCCWRANSYWPESSPPSLHSEEVSRLEQDLPTCEVPGVGRSRPRFGL